MIKGYVTIAIAAQILGVSAGTLRLWDKKGLLVARRNQATGYRLYRVSDLEHFSKHSGRGRRTQIMNLTD